MRTRRSFVLAVLFASSCVLLACGESDEDRIDAFIAAVTGEVTPARIDHVLTTYVSLDDEPLSVSVFGQQSLYRATDGTRLAEDAHRRLGRVLGKSARILKRRVDLQGTHARVELQLIGDQMLGNVFYELEKRGDKRWVVSSARFGE
jgi:hypothetical protein